MNPDPRVHDPVKYLLLIGELEGCSAHLKELGQAADRATIKEMVSRYYKLYFKSKKEYAQSQCNRDKRDHHS